MAEAGVDIDENIEVVDVSDYKPKNIPSPTGTFILGLFRLDSFPDTPFHIFPIKNHRWAFQFPEIYIDKMLRIK